MSNTPATQPRTRLNRDDSVMSAAITVMSERGYAATSIQEVADRVGVLKGSLYHYFSSKEDLLFRILEESHAENHAISEAVAELALSPLEELCEYAHRLALWYLGNIERSNIYFSDARHLSGERRTAMIASGKEFEGHIAELIDAGRERGEIDRVTDPRILTRFVLSALNSVRSWRTRATKDMSDQQIADAFLSLLRRTISTP